MPASNKRSSSSALAHLRQLCCLGLPGETVMLAVLRALHDIVPSNSNAFFWVDENLDVVNMCSERMLSPERIQLYFREYYDHPVVGFKSVFSRLVRDAAGVAVSEFDDTYGEYYDTFWRELRAHRAMYALVHSNGRPLGQLSMYRTRADTPFKPSELALLKVVSRYIAHAVSTRHGLLEGVNLGVERSADEGLATFSAEGRLLEACPNGSRLLTLASYPKIARSTMGLRSGLELPAALMQLCKRLGDIFDGEDANPPSFYVENDWGRFCFRGHVLGSNLGEPVDKVAVVIQHEKPKAVVLLDRMSASGLSVRERDVALLLTGGLSRARIADKLNITENAVGYYVRQIYSKLDVHAPREIERTLLSS